MLFSAVRTAISIRGDDIRWREDDACEIPWWSFTKVVISTAALKLVELGLLSLDKPLAGRLFTLRQLLRHEAGLPDYGRLESYQSAVARGDEAWSPQEIIDRTIEAYPTWKPGERWSYSNIGYYYVGELVKHVWKQSLGTTIHTLALAPTGVRKARLATSRGDLEAVQMGSATGYDPRWVLHGLLVGSIAEAATFLHGLLSGVVLNSSTLSQMLTVHSLPQFRDELWDHPAYGLGIMGASDGVTTPCGHTGEGPGSGIAVYGKVSNAEVSVAGCWHSPGGSRRAEKVALELLQRA